MKYLKRVLKILSLVVAAVIAVFGLILAGFALIPPAPFQPELRSVPDQSTFKLDEKIGWYQLDNGSYQMVTWGSYGGLTINDFAAVKRGYLLPRTAELFTWKPNLEQVEYQVRFQYDLEGKITGMNWANAAGEQRSAKRLQGYGCNQAEVRFRSGSVDLVGLLMTPMSAGTYPYPAVVFIHGSGKSIRDYLWYLHMADYLVKHGVAVLLPDKRGCGKSGGEWLFSSFDDYANDALAAVAFLESVPAINPEQIGLIGMSQGGFVLPLAANKSKKVRFLVSFSGSATTIEKALRFEVSEEIKDGGAPGWLVPLIEPIFSRRAKKRNGDFWRINGSFDPLPYWRKLSIPALVINGEKDKNVPVKESIAILETVRRENKHAKITIQVYENSGHGLEDPRTHWTREDCLAAMVKWIHKVL
jgi:pimeloyl-ACP methyl ester carboxylesterase